MSTSQFKTGVESSKNWPTFCRFFWSQQSYRYEGNANKPGTWKSSAWFWKM